jgi:ubiquinone/menaquinone biosynthesis methyltransferase
MNHALTKNADGLLRHKKEVPATFDKIARRYDLATTLSQGYSIDLQRSVSLMALKGDEYLLDLCCGTGKSTIHCLEALPEGKVLAVDNSAEMLNVARSNIGQNYSTERCRFVKQDVMDLDFPDNSADAIFMAYGIRNMPDYEICLKNLYHSLKPGGTLAIHEFSLHSGFLYRFYWRILGYGLIIPFSALITGNVTIFNYLIKSVLHFLSPMALRELLAKSGFQDIAVYPQRSWRRFILFTFIAKKPAF